MELEKTMKLKDFNKEFLPKTELCDLGEKFGTDKWHHGYTKVYYEIMKDKKYDTINFFEIGIYLGNSLKMWEEFFPNGKVFGTDNGRLLPNANINLGRSNESPSYDDKVLLEEGSVAERANEFSWIETDRIKCAIADQRSEEQLLKALDHFNCSEFDYILDDGQHYQEHQQRTLGLLFKNVKQGGYYIIEDVVDHDDLTTGSFWGQKRQDSEDSTDFLFMTYLKTGKLESDYITDEQSQYILDNIEDIFLYESRNRNGSPISTTSKLLVIKKK